MNTRQPNALRLADKYEVEGFLQDHRFAKDHWCRQAAAELRRLHARIEELEAAQAQRVPLSVEAVADIAERFEATDPTDSFWVEVCRAFEGAVPQWDGVIKPSDFIVDTFRSGSSGWVPKPDNCVRITHRPTGFFEEENAMRSVHANKAVAWQRLSDRLESLAAAPQPPEAAPAVSDAQIKAVFLANGFTIKEGLTDLKPYVYQAARALLAEVSAPAAPQAVLGWIHELKNGKIGSKFYTYEPHCDNAVRDDGGKKIAVVAHDPLYTAPPAQGVDAQLVAFIEKVRDFTAQAVRVGSKGGEIRWDIEFGPNDIEVRGKTLREAIAKALAAQAKKEGKKK